MTSLIDKHIMDRDDRSETGSVVSVSSGRVPGFKSKSKKKFYGSSKGAKDSAVVDADGLTPEQVHEIRYAGIRYDMYVEMGDEGFESSMGEEKKMSMAHFRTANELAAKALNNYKLLMAADVRDKLMQIEGKFDDIGVEVFAVMHTMRSYLGPRPDHAPAEITVVRLRLASGVEPGGTYHTFPSPLPIPFGKSAEYTAGEKEYHEIELNNFDQFNDDFISIFYNILLTLDPRLNKKSMAKPRFPLVICKPHFVQHTVMSFEYLHQRALLAQAAGLKSKDSFRTTTGWKKLFSASAPADFVVPVEVPLVFCDSNAVDSALKNVLRELLMVTNPISSEIDDHSKINHCHYHMTKNKLTCTTYEVCAMVEQLFIFSTFWGCLSPLRFVDPYDIENHVEPISRNSSATPDSAATGPRDDITRWTSHSTVMYTATDNSDARSECGSESGDPEARAFRAQIDSTSASFSRESQRSSSISSGALTLSSGNAGSGIFSLRRQARSTTATIVRPAFSVTDSFRSAALEPTSASGSDHISDSGGTNPTPSPTFGKLDDDIRRISAVSTDTFVTARSGTATTPTPLDPQNVVKRSSVGRGISRLGYSSSNSSH